MSSPIKCYSNQNILSASSNYDILQSSRSNQTPPLSSCDMIYSDGPPMVLTNVQPDVMTGSQLHQKSKLLVLKMSVDSSTSSNSNIRSRSSESLVGSQLYFTEATILDKDASNHDKKHSTIHPITSMDPSFPRRHSSENSVSSYSSEWSDHPDLASLTNYRSVPDATILSGTSDVSFSSSESQGMYRLDHTIQNSQLVGESPNRSPESCQQYEQDLSLHQSIENILPNNLNTGITDEQLFLTPTRDLNKLLKAKGLSRDEIKSIKSKRRTLLNRSYAASSRVKMDDHSETLKSEVMDLEKQVTTVEAEILRKQQALEDLKNKYRRTLEWARNNAQIQLKKHFIHPHIIDNETF